MSVRDALRPLVEAALASSPAALDDLTVSVAGRRRLITVVLDRSFDSSAEVTQPVEPLSLDEISDASHLVGASLDRADEVLGEQSYTLEVTSPGVSRPLSVPRHFQRNVGRMVSIRRRDDNPVNGRILRAGPDNLTIEVPSAKKTPARREDLTYAVIEHAHVEVEFSRPAPSGEQALNTAKES